MVVDIEETETEGAIEPTVDIVPVIVAELGKHNITKDLILAKAGEYAAISIAGIDDREGLKLAKEARRTLVETRTQIDKTRVNLNADALRTQRQNNAVAKELTAMIVEIEEPIDNQIKAIESELEERRKAKENEKAQRIATRTNSLIQLGATFDGVTYYINGFAVDAVEVIASPDDEFAELLQQATIARNTYVQEQARIAQEQFDEAERLRVQKEEQEAEAKRQDEERQSLLKMKLEARQSQLGAVGMPVVKTGQSYLNLESLNIAFLLTPEEILSKSVEEFGEYLTSVKTKKAESDELDEKARQKQIADDAEKDRVQRLLEQRIERLLSVGFVKEGEFYVHPMHTLPFAHIADAEFTDERFDKFIDRAVDFNTKAAKAEADAEKQRLKANKDRATRIKPDKKLLNQYLSNLDKVEMPVLANEETVNLQIDLAKELRLLREKYISLVNEL